MAKRKKVKHGKAKTTKRKGPSRAASRSGSRLKRAKAPRSRAAKKSRAPAKNRARKRPSKSRGRPKVRSTKSRPRQRLKRNKQGGLQEFQGRVFGKARFGSWRDLLAKVGEKLKFYYPEIGDRMEPDEEEIEE